MDMTSFGDLVFALHGNLPETLKPIFLGYVDIHPVAKIFKKEVLGNNKFYLNLSLNDEDSVNDWWLYYYFTQGKTFMPWSKSIVRYIRYTNDDEEDSETKHYKPDMFDIDTDILPTDHLIATNHIFIADGVPGTQASIQFEYIRKERKNVCSKILIECNCLSLRQNEDYHNNFKLGDPF